VTEIRPYCDADGTRLVALWESCGLTRPWNPPAADIALLLRSGHGEILVVAEGERIDGSVMVGHDGHRGWVYYVATDPRRRGEGLGRRLMGAAEDWLKARGVRKLEVMIRDSNTAAAGFYRRIGYAEEPVTVMSRWLDGTER
jgi:ribosomal protein S18 acetylase RimI-like enzyme